MSKGYVPDPLMVRTGFVCRERSVYRRFSRELFVENEMSDDVVKARTAGQYIQRIMTGYIRVC